MHESAATLRFGVPLPQAKLALLLIHGRGSNAEDMIGLAESLPETGVHFIAPGAAGGTWYPNRFFVPTVQNEPHLSSALRLLEQLVREAREGGLPTARIGLVGFSQGACLALEFVARHPARYALVGGLSGALIGPLDTPRPAFDLAGTPVLIGCAEHDPHIPLDFVEQSAELFARSGAAVAKEIFPGHAHAVFPAEIRWLTRQVRDTVGASSG